MPVWCRGVFLLFGAACTNREQQICARALAPICKANAESGRGAVGGALHEEGLLKGMFVILPLPTLIIPLSGLSPNALGTPGVGELGVGTVSWSEVGLQSARRVCVGSVCNKSGLSVVGGFVMWVHGRITSRG